MPGAKILTSHPNFGDLLYKSSTAVLTIKMSAIARDAKNHHSGAVGFLVT
jgi:hypothetical protein